MPNSSYKLQGQLCGDPDENESDERVNCEMVSTGDEMERDCR